LNWTRVCQQADNGFVADIIGLDYQILHLFTGKAWQYHLPHLGWINSCYGAVGDIALSMQPVAECPDGSIIGVLAVRTGPGG